MVDAASSRLSCPVKYNLLVLQAVDADCSTICSIGTAVKHCCAVYKSPVTAGIQEAVPAQCPFMRAVGEHTCPWPALNSKALMIDSHVTSCPAVQGTCAVQGPTLSGTRAAAGTMMRLSLGHDRRSPYKPIKPPHKSRARAHGWHGLAFWGKQEVRSDAHGWLADGSSPFGRQTAAAPWLICNLHQPICAST